MKKILKITLNIIYLLIGLMIMIVGTMELLDKRYLAISGVVLGALIIIDSIDNFKYL